MLIIHAQGKGIKLRVCIGWRPGVQKIACQTKPPPPSVNVSECYRMLKNLAEGHQPNHKRGKISWRDVKQYKHIKKKYSKNINLEKTYDLLLIRKQIILTWLTQVTVDFILLGFISYLVRDLCQRRKTNSTCQHWQKNCWCNWHLCICIFFECHKHKNRLQIEHGVARFA